MRDLKVNEPLITIGITTYNCASTIRRAVESALHQKWVNKEIVIVDDCSSKDTLVELKKLSQEAELVRVFYQAETEASQQQGIGSSKRREENGLCFSMMMMRAIRIEFRFSGNVVWIMKEVLQMEVRQFAAHHAQV